MNKCFYCKKEIKRFNHLGQEIKKGDIADCFDWEYCSKAERRAHEFKNNKNLYVSKGKYGYWIALRKNIVTDEFYEAASLYAEDALPDDNSEKAEFKRRVFASINLDPKTKKELYPDVVAWYDAIEKIGK